MAASLKSDEELVDWFRQRLVWDDPAVVVDLLKRGLFSRIYTPQVVAGAGLGLTTWHCWVLWRRVGSVSRFG